MMPPVKARWLELEPDPVLAFLHPADSAAQRAAAVLFCPPFGWDEMCSYRGRREWAAALARAGYPSARIALPGTGDSGGSPRDAGRVPAWVHAISGSAAWLRAETGSQRLVAIGIGLGGVLACLAARDGAPIDDLILWNVRASPRAVLREMRAHSAVVAAHHPEDERGPADRHDGDLELTGFVITAETAAALEAAQTIVPDPPPNGRRRVLLLGRDRLAVDQRLREQFEEAGAEVTASEGLDFSALMSHPQESIAPAQTIAQTVAWLQDGDPTAPAGALPPPEVPRALERAILVPGQGAPPVHETSLRLTGELDGVFALVTESAEAGPAPLCVVWLNGGALHHIGPNRAWVESARRWAARGVTTVRVDLPGIGESDGGDRRPIATDSLYYADRDQATRAILDEVAARGIGDRFVVGGLCSGAYWALHAALSDPRVAGLLLINLWAFFWTEELVAERATERSLDALRGRAWRRLIRRQLTAEQVREAVGSLRPARLRSGGGYPVQRAQGPQIEAALDHLRDQGTEALLLLCQGESLFAQISRQRLLERLDRWPNFKVAQVPTRDHMFRAAWLQRHVHDSLDAALDRMLAAAPAAPAPR